MSHVKLPLKGVALQGGVCGCRAALCNYGVGAPRLEPPFVRTSLLASEGLIFSTCFVEIEDVSEDHEFLPALLQKLVGESFCFKGGNWVNPKGGLANGGLAQEAPIGPKKGLSGELLAPPRGCEVRRNRSQSAPKRPRWALKRLQSGPKRPDFPGRIFARFSLKVWGLSPRL